MHLHIGMDIYIQPSISIDLFIHSHKTCSRVSAITRAHTHMLIIHTYRHTLREPHTHSHPRTSTHTHAGI